MIKTLQEREIREKIKESDGMKLMQTDIKPHPLQKSIQLLETLCTSLQRAKDISEKVQIVSQQPHVQDFLKSAPTLHSCLKGMDLHRQYVIKEIIAIGQGPIIFAQLEEIEDSSEKLSKLLENLLEVEQFYEAIGGIVGYHVTVLKLILEKESGRKNVEKDVRYYKPEGIDLLENTLDVHQAVRWGVEHLKDIAEIYPLGGAADRLQLKDEESGEFLPSAQLLFAGRTLLEGLIRDIQGREYLYYKLFDHQLSTPIAMMTSHEKHNHRRICHLCESQQWFGRSSKHFIFFIQPLVPVLTKEGNWIMAEPLQLMLKPGGHGVIWKKAIDAGVFNWLKEQRRSKALVRQINNPVSGVDNGLLALAGIGCQQNKDFGFASCFRRLNTPEGMNVLIEKKVSDGYEYRITNIEYTDFEQRGIEDIPESPNSPYSVFPANTNILFVDLAAIEKAIIPCPIPGMLINMKSMMSTVNSKGETVQLQTGRLESTMQNVADCIVDKLPVPLKEGQRNNLRTFLTYNLRRKTISVTKETYSGKCLIGTPEGCFYELMQDYHDLLSNYCHMEVPPILTEKEYVENGPSFIIDFHPGLGVLFGVIAQKIRRGVLAPGSEWLMEIAEADIENLNLNGSLHIQADQVLGHKDPQGIIRYGNLCGKCTLKDVTVENMGIDRERPNQYWKKQIFRKECLQIILHGNAEFFAEGVTFRGGELIEVSDGHRLVAKEKKGKISFLTEKIASPTWKWEYAFGANHQIILNKKKL